MIFIKKIYLCLCFYLLSINMVQAKEPPRILISADLFPYYFICELNSDKINIYSIPTNTLHFQNNDLKSQLEQFYKMDIDHKIHLNLSKYPSKKPLVHIDDIKAYISSLIKQLDTTMVLQLPSIIDSDLSFYDCFNYLELLKQSYPTQLFYSQYLISH